ncbi:Alkaline phosphatase D [Grifola frondosa]|uniref:Alkaline phosphatase D n=1 Tax=Grifola frondosa TaxID=5627 RepID=A0A1C7LXJ8_GRIFR|nr:Alkaline phosphatase D [Grifola frondosa]
MFTALTVSFVLCGVAAATELWDRNLAYRSPFVGDVKLSHNTRSIQARNIQLAKRQITGASAAGFTDEHYPTFYGGDFSNSPFIWNGGVNFTHSVASGDPFDDSVLLWTRAAPVSTAPGPDQSVPICVAFKIFDNSELSGRPVDSGDAFTSYDVDFTLKVEAKNLKPDTKYWYQFADCTNTKTVSPVGLTRTISSPNTPANAVNGGKPLTLAVFSCSQYQNGYFNAYGFAAHNTTADLFLHLGDYIYESLGNGANIGRQTLGRELATIADYRLRLNQYRTDVSLVTAHQNAPWITVWVCVIHLRFADQSWKAGTADSNDTAVGCSFFRLEHASQTGSLLQRQAAHLGNFQIGKLLDLTMLDTRQYDRDITDLYYNTEAINEIASVNNRSLMGTAQENWFYDTLSSSKERGAIWRIVGQQIVFTQLNEFGEFDVDAWDGYRANRNRVLDHLYNNEISNTVILSGDSHANWVSDLAHPNDTIHYNMTSGDGAIGVEFAGTAVTSPSSFGSGIAPTAADVISQQLLALNTDLQWSEGSYRGFFTLTIDPNTVNATYFAMSNISNPNLDGFASASFIVKAGANKLTRPVAGGTVAAGVLKA